MTDIRSLPHDVIESHLRTMARMLIDNRDRAQVAADRTRAAAKRQGYDYDKRADYADGSAAAYSIAGSILCALFGFPNVEEMAGGVRFDPEPLPPMLPDPDATTFAPGDDIAAAAVVRERIARSETGE